MSLTVSGSSPRGVQCQTPVFAKEGFIQAQRILGIALIAIGCLAAAFSPLSGGSLIAASFPLVALGSTIIGASLLQQVIGNSPGCERGQVKRIFAAAFLILFPVGGWIPGGLLWYLSNEDNR